MAVWMDVAAPALVALLIWWAGTGVVMLLDHLPASTHRWSLALGAAMAVGALVCIAKAAENATAAGAYAAFTCAVIVWGWHELAFLTGWMTGPRKVACSAPSHAATRFREGAQAIAWHELGLLVTLALIVALSWNKPNATAAWAFGVLWVMRLSAKFNLFLGVRNRGESFLPPGLRYLATYFSTQPFNALLPVVLVLGVGATVAMVILTLDGQGAVRAGGLLVASLLALAVVEHVLMVTPMEATVLWRWALRNQTVRSS
jgi:putative photosynthetic complex assembly protein 2